MPFFKLTKIYSRQQGNISVERMIDVLHLNERVCENSGINLRVMSGFIKVIHDVIHGELQLVVPVDNNVRAILALINPLYARLPELAPVEIPSIFLFSLVGRAACYGAAHRSTESQIVRMRTINDLLEDMLLMTQSDRTERNTSVHVPTPPDLLEKDHLKLKEAIEKRQDIVRMCIEINKTPDTKQAAYDQMLLEGAKKNDLFLVKVAIARGAKLGRTSPNPDCKGWNALHWAAYHHRGDMIRIILSKVENRVHIGDRTAPSTWPWWLGGHGGNHTAQDIAHRNPDGADEIDTLLGV